MPERTVTLSLGLDLAIPHAYVADENWRMMLYKKIARASDDATLEEVRREIADRFGEPPAVVGRLIAYARVRARAERLGVTSATYQAGRLHVRFAENAAIDAEALLALVQGTPGASLTPGRALSLPAGRGDALLEEVEQILEGLARSEAA
jgi:transcription-repair coupling factor (superfamily II helicase)